MDKNIQETARSKEISVTDIFFRGLGITSFLRRKWMQIVGYMVVGAILGLAYSVWMPPKYTAVCTFVLDESDKSGMLGQYAGLAAMAGIDLGGSGGGIFKGDNIFELYKSRLMLKKTLLSEVAIDGKKQKLIDRYIRANDLLAKWKRWDDINSINFDGNPDKFNRKQDSLITDLAEKFDQKYLDVSKPDKKLTIIRVEFSSKDEVFAKEFTDKLVQNVNDFYIQTKTKKAAQNVKVLQHQADSVKNSLNFSIHGVASAMNAAPNANPQLYTLRVPSEKKQVDVQANTAIYAEMVKNLEVSKVSLLQQTPLIQFIDQPVYPLKSNHIKKVRGMVLGAILGMVAAVFILLTGKLLTTISTIKASE